jgi:hypothetical protein
MRISMYFCAAPKFPGARSLGKTRPTLAFVASSSKEIKQLLIVIAERAKWGFRPVSEESGEFHPVARTAYPATALIGRIPGFRYGLPGGSLPAAQRTADHDVA